MKVFHLKLRYDDFDSLRLLDEGAVTLCQLLMVKLNRGIFENFRKGLRLATEMILPILNCRLITDYSRDRKK